MGNGWSKLLKDVVVWFAKNFGKDVVILVMDNVGRTWRRIFATRNVLVLGDRQSGKTSLAVFIQRGTPYGISKDGEKVVPNPTAMTAILDDKFELHKGNWLKLKQDVPGDLSLRDTWRTAINELRPQGIVYMIDGRLDDLSIARAVSSINENVLAHYQDGASSLVALHLFLNFADHWKGDRFARLRLAQDALQRLISTIPHLANLRTGVHYTQLSPNEGSWDEARRALLHFGADLTT